MFHKPRTKTYTQSDTNLLAHIVHADSRGHIFPWWTMVKADELCRENYSTKKAEWKGGDDFFPEACIEYQPLISFDPLRNREVLY